MKEDEQRQRAAANPLPASAGTETELRVHDKGVFCLSPESQNRAKL